MTVWGLQCVFTAGTALIHRGFSFLSFVFKNLNPRCHTIVKWKEPTVENVLLIRASVPWILPTFSGLNPIEHLPLCAKRQAPCALTVGPSSPSDHRCDETAYNLAELGWLFSVCYEDKKKRRASRQVAQPHSYYVAKLGLEPRVIQFQSLCFFPNTHSLIAFVSMGLCLLVSNMRMSVLLCKGVRRSELN